ncbi:MAG: DUF1735 domain-containing protein [Alistipes sp.]
MKLKYLIAPSSCCGCSLRLSGDGGNPSGGLHDRCAEDGFQVGYHRYAPAGTEISVSSSVPVNKDTKIKISLRPDLLEEYNAKYQKNYVVPPQTVIRSAVTKW